MNLSFIINKAGRNLDKHDVFNAINLYSEQRVLEEERRGFDSIDIPRQITSPNIFWLSFLRLSSFLMKIILSKS